jgi:hypothetical protein
MLAQRPKLSACQRMRRWRPILDPSDVDGCAVEVDLLPSQVNDFPGPQPMPEGKEDHQRIALPPSVAPRSGDQLLDLRKG